MFRRLSFLFALLVAAIGMPVANAYAKSAPIYTGTFSNVAVGGYDAVAYFTERKPVKGD